MPVRSRAARFLVVVALLAVSVSVAGSAVAAPDAGRHGTGGVAVDSDRNTTATNETDGARTIKVGDRTVGVVPPGGSLVAVDLPAGPTKLRALDDHGQVTHQESRTLNPAQLGTWILR